MVDQGRPAEEEHYESVPWSALTTAARQPPWLVYVIAGAVVALVVGMVAARSRPAAAPAATVTTLLTVLETTVPMSEADLQADGGDVSRAAAMRAEWFVTDYFTVDGLAGRVSDLSSALGREAPAPPGIISYVEWARAWDVERVAGDEYRVNVAIRLLTDAGEGFARGSVQAVAVRVQVSPDGGTTVLDIPEPLELPDPPPVISPDPEPIPYAVAVAAIERASAFGEPGEIIEGHRRNDTWLITIPITDPTGTPWPLLVTVDRD
ncbi:MAG: hypothetical protein HKO70_15620 [Acidimicrobiia bacterium]|nr:hypothetical protein [Acidimicrobiia bacterium]